MILCTIKDCTGEVHARGLCSPHYNRWKRAGKPEHFDGGSKKAVQTKEALLGRAFLMENRDKWRRERSERIRARERNARERALGELYRVDRPLGVIALSDRTRGRVRTAACDALRRLSWSAGYR